MSARPFARLTPAGVYLLDDGAESHFSQSEMTCRCGCGAHQVDQRLVEMLEAIRTLVGGLIHVSSGVRCWAYHKEVYRRSGKPVTTGSQHIPRSLTGGRVLESGTSKGATRAADITTDNLTPAGLRRLLKRHAERLGLVGMGAYPGFTHVDVRDGASARW